MCRVHAEVTIGDGWLCCGQSLCAEYHGGPTFSALFCARRSCVSAKACPRARRLLAAWQASLRIAVYPCSASRLMAAGFCPCQRCSDSRPSEIHGLQHPMEPQVLLLTDLIH